MNKKRKKRGLELRLGCKKFEYSPKNSKSTVKNDSNLVKVNLVDKNSLRLASTVGGAVIGNIVFPGLGGAIVGGIVGVLIGTSAGKDAYNMNTSRKRLSGKDVSVKGGEDV